MPRRIRKSIWSPSASLQRSLGALARSTLKAGSRALGQALAPARKAAIERRKPPPGPGDWLSGVALGPAGARRYQLYKPPGASVVKTGERWPLLVMLHGCSQDARGFAVATRMNRVAARAGFFVLYPEQDRLANAQGCWNWYETRSGRAQAEAATVLAALDQVCALYPVDRERVAVAGLSAGAGMAALLASRHPQHFKAVAMHSGVPPGTAQSSATALAAMGGRRTPSALPVVLPEAGEAAHWPPLLVIHGADDRIVDVRNAAAAAQLWADAAGAQAKPPRHLQRGQRHAMTVTDFKRKGRLCATLCIVDGLAHAWSGGAAGQPYSDPLGADASRMVWAFAARQFALADAAAQALTPLAARRRASG